MKRCPKCGCEEFYIDVHVVQGWLVDSDGDYITTTDECVCISHKPNDFDIWECKHCGYDDVGYVFNIEEE